MQSWLDTTLYPDVDPPEEMVTLADQVDFIARLCAAWDFGVVPYVETVNEVRQPTWCEAVDKCRLLTSHTYHLLRRWHKLPEAPYLGQKLAYIRDDPNLAYI
jgi:hypothetical protein